MKRSRKRFTSPYPESKPILLYFSKKKCVDSEASELENVAENVEESEEIIVAENVEESEEITELEFDRSASSAPGSAPGSLGDVRHNGGVI